MATVKVKICGITNLRDARLACAAGADFLGFNFYERSPRHITPARARRIVKHLPRGVAAVGVFVNEEEAKMIAVARNVGLDFVQMHGEESQSAVESVGKSVRVIRALRVNGSFRPAQLGQFKRAAAILLDGFDARLHGGTGRTFDWSVARRCGTRARVFLAGGLKAENIAEAIRAAKPYAVDVCSGVEAKPGKKDARKLKQFMSEVRGAVKKVRKGKR